MFTKTGTLFTGQLSLCCKYDKKTLQRVSVKPGPLWVCVLWFSLDADPESLPPLVCRVFGNGLYEVSPDLHRYWLLVLLVQPKPCRKIHGVKVRTVRQLKFRWNKDRTVYWRKISTVERPRSTGALSCNGATVSMETTQVVVDLYQTFYSQSVGKWLAIISAEHHR